MTFSADNLKPGFGNTVADWLTQVRLGTPQIHRGIVLWPLFLPEDQGPNYLTLDEALGTNQAQVTEISQGGSVPQLKVINQAIEALLILDGEELIGAKQNRVVNATLLLPGKSETIIPVSCTEQGRWRHVSNAFSPSDEVMEMKIRRSKMRSVSDHLKEGVGHQSDQGQIWAEIQALHAKAKVHSSTSALHDTYQSRQREIQAALEAFPCQPGQHGLLVSLRGQVVGCDVVSRAGAYARLHAKLVRSYVLDAILETPQGESAVDEAKAQSFLVHLANCREERFPSVGYGESLRFENGEIAGAALAYEGTIIHVAAFSAEPGLSAEAKSQRMARLKERRRRLFDGLVE